ncbi:hypothetical protein A3F06_01265 [candidate division TM6 bacterium RIFCSPHIGHO2_12_FULL_36_22]|nr:MAG: hypothetical protein A3F06_01265 [candidate division TM6 bacterium RIFCSPHIGHO2_12_FULL_36_22]
MNKSYILIFFLFCVGVVFGEQNKVELLIKFPTRERSEKFFQYLDQYYKLLSGKHTYYFLITCDSNDASMNNEKIKKRFESYENLKVIYGNSTCKIHACNRDMEYAPSFDIVLIASDDMWPNTQNYDEIIVEAMQKNFPDLDGVLNFADGSSKGPCVLNTYPIIGRRFFDRYSYIYSPAYESFFPDFELSVVSRLLEKELILNIELLKHKSPGLTWGGPDDLYMRNLHPYSNDAKIFAARLAKAFGLEGLTKKQKRYLLFCEKKMKEAAS